MITGNNNPASLECSDDEGQIDISEIISKNKNESFASIMDDDNIEIEPLSKEEQEEKLSDQELEQIELEMLVEECEELISKISPNVQSFFMQDETINTNLEESFSSKKEKNRLEKEYVELCLEIERQQKELHNYRFKVQVAHKEAEHYARQIKEKSAILEGLDQHNKSKSNNLFKKK